MDPEDKLLFTKLDKLWDNIKIRRIGYGQQQK